MTILDLQSEPFSPMGNIGAEGALNTLGRPNLYPLTLMIRETVQNSWDARLADGIPVRYSIDSWQLSGAQKMVLASSVFAGRPRGLDLGSWLSGDAPLTVLAVSDRNTQGLCGPTRADSPFKDGEQRHFINFVRNYGRDTDRAPGGGTYGYGKSSLYQVSGASTILVYSRIKTTSGLESRFIAIGLGAQTDGMVDGRPVRLTGRHWWGQLAIDGVVDPLTGSAADQLAGLLGMPGFAAEETGTTLLVIAPQPGEYLDMRQAMQLMVHSLLWFCWPKMVSLTGSQPPAMLFTASLDGQPVAVPRPENQEPFRTFALTLQEVENARRCVLPDKDNNVQMIEMIRPGKRLGLLAIRRFATVGESVVIPAGLEKFSPFSAPFRHVALMRKPMLVVRYEQGAELPLDLAGYAGVFVAADDTDAAFARAEPPTHDDWVPATMKDPGEKRIVNVGLRRIKEKLVEFTQPQGWTAHGDQPLPLGSFARFMGGLIPGAEGPGAESQWDGGRNRTGGKKEAGDGGLRASRVDIVSGSRLEFIDGGAVAVTGFTVSFAAGRRHEVITVLPEVSVLDGQSRESEAPVGAEMPQVRGWRTPRGARLPASTSITIPAGPPAVWFVEVTVPENTMVNIVVQVAG